MISLTPEDLKDLGTTLRAREILVLDDLLELTPEVEFLLKYGVHRLTQSFRGYPNMPVEPPVQPDPVRS